MGDLDAGRVGVRVQTRPAVHLSVIDAGPRGASPVLFSVQGVGGHALQRVNQLQHLSKSHRGIAPDLRGHGRSDKPRRQVGRRLDLALRTSLH